MVVLNSVTETNKASGRLAVRSIGLADLVEQAFNYLQPNTSFTLALSTSLSPPFKSDYVINRFDTDGAGKYSGQSTGLIKAADANSAGTVYHHVILIDNTSNKVVLISTPEDVKN